METLTNRLTQLLLSILPVQLIVEAFWFLGNGNLGQIDLQKLFALTPIELAWPFVGVGVVYNWLIDIWVTFPIALLVLLITLTLHKLSAD